MVKVNYLRLAFTIGSPRGAMERIVRQRRAVLAALGVVALVSLAVAMLVGKQEWDGLLLNFGTEVVGAALTYSLFESFIGRAEKREEEKACLITQLGIDVRDVGSTGCRRIGAAWLAPRWLAARC